MSPSKATKLPSADKATTTNRRRSARERKLALLQDVDKLKRELRHEENVHRALERAFSRPLGALPRLPPYLPPYMLELLAEVAVLEEEIVRLEELVVNFRQDLYQEAVYTSSTRTVNNVADSSSDMLPVGSRRRRMRSCSQSEIKLESFVSVAQPLPSLTRSASARKLLSPDSDGRRYWCDRQDSNMEHLLDKLSSPLDDKLGKENHSLPNPVKDKLSLTKKPATMKTTLQVSPVKPQSTRKCADPLKIQCSVADQMQESSSDNRVLEASSEANKISEDVLKCLCNIFMRLSTLKGKTLDAESFSFLIEKDFGENNLERDYRDPYCVYPATRMRDIGPYGRFHSIEAFSIDMKRKTNALFLIRRLKLLLSKLASVKLEGLTHPQKLAFWINTYNSCMMNAYLEHGIPERPEVVVTLMQKARFSFQSRCPPI